MDGDEARVDEIVGIETIDGSEGARTSKGVDIRDVGDEIQGVGDEIRGVGDENSEARANESVGEDGDDETRDADSNEFRLSAVAVRGGCNCP